MFTLTNILYSFLKSIFNFQFSKIILKTDQLIIVDKTYDFKINSNTYNEKTVQTFLRNMFPSLASKKLVHEFYFVHRLDFATSGLLCIPIDKKTCAQVAKAFSKHQTRKYYVALVRGWVSQEHIIVDVQIGQDLRFQELHKMCSNGPYCNNPKTSKTVIMVLEKGMFGNYPCTKVLIRTTTGRRHQIRVHCNHLGHTIVGDFTYSNRKDNAPYRMFLHSLRLIIPLSNENVDVKTEDPFAENERNWRPIELLNHLDSSTYNKLDLLC